jgi:hypothetical protein
MELAGNTFTRLLEPKLFMSRPVGRSRVDFNLAWIGLLVVNRPDFDRRSFLSSDAHLFIIHASCPPHGQVSIIYFLLLYIYYSVRPIKNVTF